MTPRNIDDVLIRLANRQDVEWSTAKAALQTIFFVTTYANIEIDWDWGAGEDWIRGLLDHNTVFMVSTVVPLVLVDQERSSAIGYLDGEVEAVTLVDGFQRITMSCSMEPLLEVFADAGELTISGFSGDDFFVQTV